MTKKRTHALTALAVGLFVLLCWVFADGLLAGPFWKSSAVSESSVWTYALLLTIVIAGYVQARRLPVEGATITHVAQTTSGQIDDPIGWKLLIGNTYFALLWMPIRFFVGREWLGAGEHKVRDDAWMKGGAALKEYWERSVTVPEGKEASPAGTYVWFQDFLSYMLRHGWYTWFAKVVAVGEVLVGIGLIVGALVGIAAFFGATMNLNYQLAGSASSNPVLFGLGVLLVLGWKVAGYWGLDRYLLPMIGTPWKKRKIFGRTMTPNLKTAQDST